MGAPTQDGEILVEFDDIQAGDVIWGREFNDWEPKDGWPGHLVLTPGPDGTIAAAGDRSNVKKLKILSLGRGRWRVVKKPGTTVPASAKKLSSMWNGRCRNCGSNIYVGFNMVEHEGGPCA